MSQLEERNHRPSKAKYHLDCGLHTTKDHGFDSTIVSESERGLLGSLRIRFNLIVLRESHDFNNGCRW